MIFRASENPIEIPDVALASFLLERAARYGDKAAFIDGPTGRVMTYAEWAGAVRRCAASLAQRGLQKGEVLAIYCANCPEYSIVFFGVALLGAIATTINPLYTAEELRKQLDDCGAKILVTQPAFVERTVGMPVRETIVIGEASFDALLKSDGVVPRVKIDAANDVVTLPYSSGTTGLPKGVMLTHRNLLANILQAASVTRIQTDDVTLAFLPFFHIYGMVVVMGLGLYAGATIVTMPRFDLEQCLQLTQRYRITYVYVVPPIFLALRSPLVDKYDVSSVRILFSGAAPLSADVAMQVAKRLDCEVVQGYGMTEASPATHVTRPGETSGVGQPLPNTEAKIVDLLSGADLGPHQEGEVCVRGPQVMKGYLNRPDATAKMIDRDGWLHTGDVGFADDDGRFFIVDRVKELIKYKGLQIAPAELEALLLTHPKIADAAVVPMADEEAGQVPKAFVVLRSEATPDEIKAFVASHVAPYKKLRAVEITDAIPRSPSGKILRRLLSSR